MSGPDTTALPVLRATKEELMFQSKTTASASRHERRSLIAPTPALVIATLALVLVTGRCGLRSSQLGGGASLPNSVTFHKLTLVKPVGHRRQPLRHWRPSAGVYNGVVYLSGSLAQPPLGVRRFCHSSCGRQASTQPVHHRLHQRRHFGNPLHRHRRHHGSVFRHQLRLGKTPRNASHRWQPSRSRRTRDGASSKPGLLKGSQLRIRG